jgi:GNAT superfamily N-acetyltransferase
MSEGRRLAATICEACSDDAEGIARTFLESAAYHASLDPERYSMPALEMIAARYRETLQPPSQGRREATLIAEVDGEIVGFIDVRLERSPDLMHRDITYCHVSEIAVRSDLRGQGIGCRLLDAAEGWGREAGAEFASLEFHAENKRADLFYEQRGYHPASITAIKRL